MAFTIPHESDAAFGDQAELDKGDFAILVAGIAGDGVISGCAVTAQTTPDMTVAVAAGTVVVGGQQANVAAGNLAIGAADPTNPRFDLVTVNSSGTKAVVAGTPAPNPVFPAVPSGSVVLAAVYVPAGDTAIQQNQIVDKRVFVEPPATPSGWTTVTATADVSRTSTTLANDPVLSFDMAADQKYRIRVALHWTVSGGTSGTLRGVAFQFNGPASPTLVRVASVKGTRRSSTGTITDLASRLDVALGQNLGATNNDDGFQLYYLYEVIVHNGANAGTFSLSWAVASANGETVTRRAGSYLEYAQV